MAGSLGCLISIAYAVLWVQLMHHAKFASAGLMYSIISALDRPALFGPGVMSVQSKGSDRDRLFVGRRIQPAGDSDTNDSSNF